jgi:hypothetical protein
MSSNVVKFSKKLKPRNQTKHAPLELRDAQITVNTLAKDSSKFFIPRHGHADKQREKRDFTVKRYHQARAFNSWPLLINLFGCF